MKLKFLPILFMSILALTACSDDDDDPVVKPVQTEKQFKGAELDLKVNGGNVLGKEVLFTPDESDPTAATITFRGEYFDLNTMMNGTKADIPSGYATSSVFAGEREVKLPITMRLSGDMGSFEGNGESTFYTYNYKGMVHDSRLAIELSEVTLKDSRLAGTAWNLDSIKKSKYGAIESVPVLFQWESAKKLSIELFPGQAMELSMSQVLALVLSMNVIPVNDSTKVSVPEMLATMFQGVEFGKDGNIKASYIDMNTKRPATSPDGLAQYVIANDSVMKLVLNPFAIAANASKDKNEGQESQVSQIMKSLTPMILQSLDADRRLTEGIEVIYKEVDGKLNVYIDEALLLPVLKTFAPILQNEQLIATIVAKVKENPEMAAMAPMIEAALKQMPEIINTTTDMQLGLVFAKR